MLEGKPYNASSTRYLTLDDRMNRNANYHEFRAGMWYRMAKNNVEFMDDTCTGTFNYLIGEMKQYRVNILTLQGTKQKK